MEDYKKSKKFVSQVVTELLRSKDDQLIRTMARHDTARRGLIKRIDTLEVTVDARDDQVKAVQDELVEYDRTIHVLNRALVANMSDRDAARDITHENLRRRDAVSTAAQNRSHQQAGAMDTMRQKLRSMEHELASRKQSESTLTANIAALKRALEMLLAKAENVMDVKGAQAVEQLIQDAEQDLSSMKELNGDPKLMKLAQERQKDIQEMSKVKKEMDKLHLDKKNMEQALRKAEQDVVQMRLRLMERDSAMAMAGKRVKAFETKLEEESAQAAKRVAEAEKHAVEVAKRFEEKMAVLVKNMDEKEKQLAEQTRMADHYRTQAQEEKSRLTRLRQELLDAQEEAEAILRLNYNKEKTRADQLEKDLSTKTTELTSRLQLAEQAARESEQSNTVVQKQLATALQRLQDAQDACDDKEEEILELQTTLESIQHVAARKESELVRAQSSISLLTAERDQQMDRLEQIALANMQQHEGDDTEPSAASASAAGRSAKGRRGRTPKNLDLSSPPDEPVSPDAQSHLLSPIDGPLGGGGGKKRQGGKGVKIVTDTPSPLTTVGATSPASSPTHAKAAAAVAAMSSSMSSMPSLNPPKLSPRSERVLRYHTVLADALAIAAKGNATATTLSLETLQKKMAQIVEWRTTDERASHPAIAKRLDLSVQEITAAILSVLRGPDATAPTGEGAAHQHTAATAEVSAASSKHNTTSASSPLTKVGAVGSSSNALGSSTTTTAPKPKRSLPRTTSGKTVTKPRVGGGGTASGSTTDRNSAAMGMINSVDVIDSDGGEEDDEEVSDSTHNNSLPGPATAASTAGATTRRQAQRANRKGSESAIIDLHRDTSPPPDAAVAMPPAAMKPAPAAGFSTVTLGFEPSTTTVIASELRPRPTAANAAAPSMLSDSPTPSAATSFVATVTAAPNIAKPSQATAATSVSPMALHALDDYRAVGTSFDMATTRDSTASPMAPKTPPVMSERGIQVELPAAGDAGGGGASAAHSSGSSLAARKAQRNATQKNTGGKAANPASRRSSTSMVIIDPDDDTPPLLGHGSPHRGSSDANHLSALPAVRTGAAGGKQTTSSVVVVAAPSTPAEWRTNHQAITVEMLLAVAEDFNEATRLFMTAEATDRVSLQAQLTRRVWHEYSTFRSAVARMQQSDLLGDVTPPDRRRLSLNGGPARRFSHSLNDPNVLLQRSGTMKPSDAAAHPSHQAVAPHQRAQDAATRAVLHLDGDRRHDRLGIALQLQSAVAVLSQIAATGEDDEVAAAQSASGSGSLNERPMSKAQQLRSALNDVADRVTTLVTQTELELRAPPPSAASGIASPPLMRRESSMMQVLSGRGGGGGGDAFKASSSLTLESGIVNPRALSPVSTAGGDESGGRALSPFAEGQLSLTMLPRMASIRSTQPTAAVASMLQAVGAFLREAQSFAEGLSGTPPTEAGADGTERGASRSSSPSPVQSAHGGLEGVRLSPPRTHMGNKKSAAAAAAAKSKAASLPQLTADQVSTRLKQVLDRIRLGVELKEQQTRQQLLLGSPQTGTSSSPRISPQLTSYTSPSLDVSNRDGHLDLKKRKQAQLKELLRRRHAAEEGSSSGSDAGSDLEGKRTASNLIGNRKYTFTDGKPVPRVTADAATTSQDDLWNTEKINNLAQEYVNAQAVNTRLTAEVDELMNFIQNEPDLRRIADAVAVARGTAPRVHLDDSDDDEAASRYDPVVRSRKAREKAVRATLAAVRQRLESLELEQLFDNDVRNGLALALATDASEPVRAVSAAETLTETRSRSLRAIIAQLTQHVTDAEHGGHFVGDMMKSFPRAVVTQVAKSGCAPAVTSELIVQLADWWNEWRKRAQDAGAERTQAQQQSLERLMLLCDRLETAAISSAAEFSTVAETPAAQPRSSSIVMTPPVERPVVVPVTGSSVEHPPSQRSANCTPPPAWASSPAGALVPFAARLDEISTTTTPLPQQDTSAVLSAAAAMSPSSSAAVSGIPCLLQRHAILDALEGTAAPPPQPPSESSIVAAHLLASAQSKREVLLSRLDDDRLCHTPGAFSCTAPPGTSSAVSLQQRPLKGARSIPPGGPTSVFTALGQRDMRAGLESRGSLRSRDQVRRPGTVAAREQHVNFDAYLKSTLPKVPSATTPTPHGGGVSEMLLDPSARAVTPPPALTHAEQLSSPSVQLPPVTPPPASPAGGAFVPPPTAAAGMRRRMPLPTAASQPLERDRVSRQSTRALVSRGVDDDLGRHWNSAARTPVVKTKPTFQ